MARRGDFGRQIVVSVVGVSGGEKEKGVTGVGKSCLCNRFMRPQADNYHVDHISVLSQTDFSGRVVNNDHFLYWGESRRSTEDGVDFNFHVIEQTEFIDDASFMPFKAGKMDPYIKRCCTTKIQSAEKLMYICKNQLGIEKEYEQRLLPDGKLNVDGFLCIFDVSQIPNRPIERMVETTAAILMNCVKTKRPVVLVTTKNDEGFEIYIKEAEKLCCRKEFKGNIPLVESSAHENVNVEAAFLTLAQLVDRNRGKIRILSYLEATRQRKDVLDMGADTYLRLIRSLVTDYRTVWSSACKKLAVHPEFAHYVELFGIDSAARMFRRHVKRLKEDFLQRKVISYMELLPSILREFFPDLQSLGDGSKLRFYESNRLNTLAVYWDWLSIQQRISDHLDFDVYFVRCSDDIPWTENLDFLDSTDSRIPFEVLDSNEAETVFKNHVNALQAELEMRELPRRMRDRFKMLLAETGYVTPGKKLEEVRVLFMGRESFDSLPEHDRQIIYEQHQKDITEKAKYNFLELLLEHAELFYHVKSTAPMGTLTQDDIREITETLQEDSRYKALDRLHNERNLILLQHLAFIHCPKIEHCPSYPSCTDAIIQNLLSSIPLSNNRPSSGTWSSSKSDLVMKSQNDIVKLAILGLDGLAQELHDVVMSLSDNGQCDIDGKLYKLELRVIEGDISLPENSLKTMEFLPNGIFCAYNSEDSLEYIKESVESSLLTQLENEESSSSPCISVLYASDTFDANSQELHDKGACLAESLQSNFLDAGTSLELEEGGCRFNNASVLKALKTMISNIQNRRPIPIISNVQKDSEPDIRIIMCMLCGDPYSIENVLSPLINHPSAVVTGERSIALHTFLDDCKRRVEVIVSSYHGAIAFREDLVHGFILVYSTKRKASLCTLRAFSSNIPNLPIQILAITDTNSATAFFSSDVSQQLITEGNNIADRLQAHFMTSAATCQQKSAFYTPFFKEVWDKKPEIEQAFTMEDHCALDDSGEGTLERPNQLYGYRGSNFHFRRLMQPRSHSAEGSSSEIYETVPTDGSLGDDLDEALSPSYPDQPLTPSDDSDIYSHIDNDEEEHLVKPSLLKKHHKFHPGERGGLQVYPPPTTPPEPAPPDRECTEGPTRRLVKATTLPATSIHSTTARTSLEDLTCWVDDSVVRREEYWIDSNYGPHLFTTGRRGKVPPPPIRPKPKNSQTLKQPGKLNLKAYSNVTDAITKISLKDGEPKLTKTGNSHAPLATPENMDLGSEYATVKDAVPGICSYDGDYSYSRVPEIGQAASAKARQRQRREKAYSDSDSDWSSMERRRSSEGSKSGRKSVPKKKKKRIPIPVATPRVPPMFPFVEGTRYEEKLLEAHDKGKEAEPLFGMPEDESSIDIPSPRDPQSPVSLSSQITRKDAEKNRRKEKQRTKEEEKRKNKEEEKAKKEKEREKKRISKGGVKAKAAPTLEDFAQSDDKAVPLFVEKCVRFIETEGLDSEGIYRVPGNKIHVEQITNKFKDEGEVDFIELDIPVNAAATALKDFLKQLPPLLPQSKLEELTTIAGIGDRSCRLLKLKEMLTSLPNVNFEVLKFIFQHFVRVAENCKLNSMDSKNLAICWWPTLLHTLQFNDISEFESKRPHIEDIIQTMIDQFPFLFQGKEDYVMV